VSAALITTLVDHPASPIRMAVGSDIGRRALIGVGMGLTAIALIYSKAGQRSGAHFNPAVTFTFWRLGKVRGRDAIAYVAAQFAGAVAGLGLAAAVGRQWLAHDSVAYIATRPGPLGVGPAFAAEAAISFGIMTLVLVTSNQPRLARFTGLFVGITVASYITLEGPLSGMSMNPARTLAPLVVGGVATPLWIYFTAPPLGMLAAGVLFSAWRGPAAIKCAKLRHPASGPCPFVCGYVGQGETAGTAPASKTPIAAAVPH
jgi:aquaporin Z